VRIATLLCWMAGAERPLLTARVPRPISEVSPPSRPSPAEAGAAASSSPLYLHYSEMSSTAELQKDFSRPLAPASGPHRARRTK